MKFDKYCILCLFACILLIAFSLNYKESDDENENLIGIPAKVSNSSSGYTFSFETVNGSTMNCFSKTKPELNSICIIEGSYSKDGSMFFVSDFKYAR